jgi:hypothetical protein
MRIEKLIAGLILLPIILFVLLILLPLILIYGVIMLLLHKPVHYTFRRTTANVRNPEANQNDDVIDVEVIHSESGGEKDDLSERSLNR